MAKIELDFAPGDKMIVMKHDKFELETFSGNFTARSNNGNTVIEYGVGKKDSYGIEEKWPADQCFRDIKEVIELTGIAYLCEDFNCKIDVTEN